MAPTSRSQDAAIHHHSGLPIDPDIGSSQERSSGTTGQRSDNWRFQVIVLIALGCGGALGALSRYAISLGLPVEAGRFPWGTFIVNISGSAVLGFGLVVLMEQFPRARLARAAIGTGFIGAYTTFSTFAVESVLLFRAHSFLTGVVYVLASVIAGLVVIWLGMTCARMAIRAQQWIRRAGP